MNLRAQNWLVSFPFFSFHVLILRVEWEYTYCNQESDRVDCVTSGSEECVARIPRLEGDGH